MRRLMTGGVGPIELADPEGGRRADVRGIDAPGLGEQARLPHPPRIE